MTQTTLSALLSMLFFSLSALHIYWAFGGKLLFEASLPTDRNGNRVLNPKKIDSALVALVLMGFGAFYLINAGAIPSPVSENIHYYSGWLIPAIFILRSIGDFKYVGFFKKIRSTSFAKNDTRFISPLCLAIGLAGLLTQIYC